jgi:hypothetical protein
MGYLLGYKYEAGYRVWMPRIGVREVRDVVFYEGTAPTLPDHGSTIVVEPTVQIPVATITPSALTPAPSGAGIENDNTDETTPAAAQEKIIIRLPGRYHPRAQTSAQRH